jgi:hypothetical protein
MAAVTAVVHGSSCTSADEGDLVAGLLLSETGGGVASVLTKGHARQVMPKQLQMRQKTDNFRVYSRARRCSWSYSKIGLTPAERSKLSG